jgi:hypothetical protein
MIQETRFTYRHCALNFKKDYKPERRNTGLINSAKKK